MKARAVKSFPIGKEWMYEPKWDGFRCLIFRDEENIFLQSRTGKSLTSGFLEIVAAFQTLSLKRFVLDGELAMPTENGFSFDGLVNRLRIGGARLALEARDSPAMYIAFDMLANSENLLGSPFRLRRKTLERFFENSVPRSSRLYLSASTEDLREVEKWVGTSDSNSTVLSASAPMRRTLSVAFRPQKNVILPSSESRWSRFGLSTRHQSRRSCSNFGESMT